MQKLLSVVLLSGLAMSIGCSEFVKSTQQSASVDDEDEDNGSTTDHQSKTMYPGSAPPFPEEEELLTDTQSTSLSPMPFPDELEEEINSDREPDVVGAFEEVKPVSLKTTKFDFDVTE